MAEPSFPVYTSKSLMKPLELSALTHTLKPLLMGFMGRYCFSEDRPLYLTIASSMAHSRRGEYTSRKECRTASIAGRTFPRRSYPSSPRTGRESLSTKCRYRRSSRKRFLEMREATGKQCSTSLDDSNHRGPAASQPPSKW